MPKCSLLSSVLQTKFVVVLFYAQCVTAVVTFFAYCSLYEYESIPRHEIENVLLKVVNPNLKINPEKPLCGYELIYSKESYYGREVPVDSSGFQAKGIAEGGFAPTHCTPQFSVAVLVPYRGRQAQLDIFLPYIHNFLRKQDIHYKVYLIEQQDAGPWNKGALYNAGARVARAAGWPCLVLHDVDLLPLDAANLYACLRRPRHLSAAVDKFRYVLPYDTLIGGVAAVSAEQYWRANGFSNLFTGWGGEDDDFAERLRLHDLQIYRFPREMSRYVMLRHRAERPNPGRRRALREGGRRASRDGLSGGGVPAAVRLSAHRLFTLVAVTLNDHRGLGH